MDLYSPQVGMTDKLMALKWDMQLVEKTDDRWGKSWAGWKVLQQGEPWMVVRWDCYWEGGQLVERLA